MNALRWNPPLRNAKHGLKRVTSRKISGGEKGVLGSHTASSTPRAVSAASANETAATTLCTRPRRRRRSPPRRLQRVQRVERTAKPQLRKPREHRRATRG